MQLNRAILTKVVPMERPVEHHKKREELRAKREELHGKRRKLHERLSEICEDFVLEELTKEFKQKAVVHELRYLLDYYQDDATWEGIK